MRTPLFRFLTLAAVATFAFGITAAEASWIWSPDIGKWINPKKTAKDTPEEQYDWALQFFNQKDWDRSIEEFEKLTDSFPTSRLAAEGVYYTGQAYEQKDDTAKAADNYQKLVDRYPYSDRIKDAMRREFEIANEFSTGGKVKVLGVPVLPGQDKALELYNHIVKNAPYGTFGDQAQFKIGELYKMQGEYELSRKAYQSLVDEYPTSDLVPQARYEIARSSMLASNTHQYSDEHAAQAIEEFQEYKKEFHDKPQAVEADESIKQIRVEKARREFEIAAFYEKNGKLKSAKVYFEEVVSGYPETPSAAEAKKRIDGIVLREAQPGGGPKFGLPKVSLPKVSMPRISLPKVSMPNLNPWAKPAVEKVVEKPVEK